MPSQNPIERQSLSVSEFAKAHGLSTQTIYRLVEHGKIESIRLGRSIRIPVDAFAKERLDAMAAAKKARSS